MNCSSTVFPFHQLPDDDDLMRCINCELDSSYRPTDRSDLSLNLSLNLYTDIHENRPLLQNRDLDPDEHYFSNQPNNCRYSTLTDLNSKPVTSYFTFMHINCRSISNKISDIQLLLTQLNVDVLAVTETWLDYKSVDTIKIPEYTFVHKCRETGCGGGVGFFIKYSVPFQLLDPTPTTQSHTSYESLFLSIPQKKGPHFVLGTIYRPPGQNLDTFNDEFNTLLSELTKRHHNIHLAGDYNINLLKYLDHTRTNCFINCITTHHFLPMITRPTRIIGPSSTLIDNILTNVPTRVIDSVIVAADISDHLPVLIHLDLTPLSNNESAIHLSRNVNDSNMEQFKSLLLEIDWSLVLDSCNQNNPTAAYDSFVGLFKAAYDKAFPLLPRTRHKRHSPRQPWMTSGLLKSCRTKSKLYLKMIKHPTATNKANYISYRNKFKSLRIKTEKNYYASEFQKYNSDLKHTWKVIRSILNTSNNNTKIDELCINGVKITDAETMAERFNSYFSSIAQTLSDKIPASQQTFQSYMMPSLPDSFALTPTTPEELISINQSLKLTHSSGPDDINPYTTSAVLNLLATPLSEIINSSFATGIVPPALKIARVTPIYKQGNRSELGNYRPISVLPYFSKLIERAMYNRLYDYVTKMNILYLNQHGFQAGHSTAMSLLNIQDKISQSIENNEYSVGIFLDLSKAFDCVDHKILFKKLDNYGIRGLPLLWFKSYLNDRQQQVQCNTKTSKFRFIEFGVPQGSILGPLLFLLYINDLPHVSSVLHFELFADDSNVFISHKSHENLFQIMNLELPLVGDWFKANRLCLNLSKTSFILFNSHRKITPKQTPPLLIDGVLIPQITKVNFLGVVIDQNLTWKEHISQISIKLAKNIGILSRISYKLPINILTNLYYSLIHPYLAYCNIVWASNYTSRLTRLIILQKRAVRVITKSYYKCHTAQLFLLHRILTLDQIRTLQTGEFMFRYKHDSLPHTFADYFSTGSATHSYSTRTASNYRPIFAHTNTRKFSIKIAGPTVWNNLPPNIQNVSHLLLFKKLLRAHLLTLNI